jgi:hypothetical protein
VDLAEKIIKQSPSSMLLRSFNYCSHERNTQYFSTSPWIWIKTSGAKYRKSWVAWKGNVIVILDN